MTRIGFTFVMCLMAALPESLPAADEPVVIRMRDSVNVASRIVQIGHVAEVVGGSRQLRDRIRQLDLTEVTTATAKDPEVISRPLVRVRLLLADVSRSDYVLLGAEEVQVFPGRADIRDERILNAIRDGVAIELKLAREDVQVKLTHPIADSPDGVFDQQLRFSPFLPPVVRPGRTRIKLGVFNGRTLVRTVNASVEIRLVQTVATAKRRLERGEILSLENLSFERKALTTRTGIDSPDDLLGGTVRRTINEGQPVQLRDLEGGRKDANPYIIHARDVVKVKARRGTLTVYLHQGEALSNGRLGENIRVRNPRGRQIITGKVISSTEVEVTF